MNPPPAMNPVAVTDTFSTRTAAETALFKAAIAHWKKPGGDVEVWEELRVRRTFPDGDFIDRRAILLDALFRKAGVLSAVEGKAAVDGAGLFRGLTMDLYTQCKRWQKHAHCVYALIRAPEARYTSPEAEHAQVLKLAKIEGIGVIAWDGKADGKAGFAKLVKARMNAAAEIACLLEAIATHRNHLPAGSASGHRSHPRDRKWDWVIGILAREQDSGFDGGLTIKELSSEHALEEGPLTKNQQREVMRAAESGWIQGVRVRTKDGIRRLVLEQEART